MCSQDTYIVGRLDSTLFVGALAVERVQHIAIARRARHHCRMISRGPGSGYHPGRMRHGLRNSDCCVPLEASGDCAVYVVGDLLMFRQKRARCRNRHRAECKLVGPGGRVPLDLRTTVGN